MRHIAVLFSGKGSNLAYIAQTMHKKELEIVVAMTNNPEAEGIRVAEKYGIPVEVIDSSIYPSREAFDREVVRTLKAYNPALTVLAGFMRILTPLFTSEIRAINLHPSLLPRHKGLHAIEKSYFDTYETGGATAHVVSSELDGGEILIQKEISKRGLTLQAYEAKIKTLEKEVLAEGIRMMLYGKKVSI